MIPQNFLSMESEYSLSCPQDPASGSCPDPYESIPHLRLSFFEVSLNVKNDNTVVV
jgi:hypothetical protein